MNTFLFVGIVLLLRLASEPTANLSFVVIAVYATLGRSHAIKALALCWLFTMVSPGIAPGANLGNIGRYLVFAGALIPILSQIRINGGVRKSSSMVLAVIGLGVTFTLHTLFVSAMPMVSILKIVSWVMVTATLFSAWAGLSDDNRQRLQYELYTFLVIIMLVSIPLFFMPLGYIRNGTGFQGILNHPQAFGATMAVLAVITITDLLSRTKPSWPSLGICTISFTFILASEARTAGLALLLALMIALSIGSILFVGKVKELLPGARSKRLFGLMVLLIFVSVPFAPQIVNQLDNFISKSGRTGADVSVTEAYEMSRGELINVMMKNINAHPITGIGFGIASEPESMKVERDPFLGLPISASIEKGVMPLAVVEELGLPIAILVFVWLFRTFWIAAQKGIRPLALILTVIFINMGENVFFSPGGMGMLILIAFSWSASKQTKVICARWQGAER